MDVIEQAITNYACWLLKEKDGEQSSSPSLFDLELNEIERLKNAYDDYVIPLINSDSAQINLLKIYANQAKIFTGQKQPDGNETAQFEENEYNSEQIITEQRPF